MKHKTLQTLIALSGALTLALAVGLLVLTPRIAEAIPVCGESPEECFCPTGGQQQTAMVWGMGASCGEAFQDAVNQTRAMMNCLDGVCSETFVVTTNCWNHNGQWQVDGYSLFKCYVCWGGPC